MTEPAPTPPLSDLHQLLVEAVVGVPRGPVELTAGTALGVAYGEVARLVQRTAGARKALGDLYADPEATPLRRDQALGELLRREGLLELGREWVGGLEREARALNPELIRWAEAFASLPARGQERLHYLTTARLLGLTVT